MMVKVDCCEHGNLIGQWCFNCEGFEAIGIETKKLRAAEADVESLKAKVESLEAEVKKREQQIADFARRTRDDMECLQAKLRTLEGAAREAPTGSKEGEAK